MLFFCAVLDRGRACCKKKIGLHVAEWPRDRPFCTIHRINYRNPPVGERVVYDVSTLLALGERMRASQVDVCHKPQLLLVFLAKGNTGGEKHETTAGKMKYSENITKCTSPMPE